MMFYFLLLLACTAAATTAASYKYMAIPLDDVNFFDMPQNNRPLARLPRKTFYPRIEHEAQKDANEQQYQPFSDEESRVERQSGGGGGGHHEYVDFGAHTGHHGAFGWYADFPVRKGS